MPSTAEASSQLMDLAVEARRVGIFFNLEAIESAVSYHEDAQTVWFGARLKGYVLNDGEHRQVRAHLTLFNGRVPNRPSARLQAECQARLSKLLSENCMTFAGAPEPEYRNGEVYRIFLFVDVQTGMYGRLFGERNLFLNRIGITRCRGAELVRAGFHLSLDDVVDE